MKPIKMKAKVFPGLDVLLNEKFHHAKVYGNICYLGNEASVTHVLSEGLLELHRFAGKKLIKAFGPQHGFSTVDQDNMIETQHTLHPHLGIPVFSLYGETREPSPEMLEHVDTIIVDLQDVGTRVYTYIWTMLKVMEACVGKDIEIIILDRPNPLGGLQIEGNLPVSDWFSFVCLSEIPMRHGLTMGEMAQYFKKYHRLDIRLRIVKMRNWSRDMIWHDTGLTWINPSPNLATPNSAMVYPGTVLVEGTNLSEGRGTTRSLELIGHPELKPYKLLPILEQEFRKAKLNGFVLRPIFFIPTFHKHKNLLCGGFHIHAVDPVRFKPWASLQILLRTVFHHAGITKFWNEDPYEYEFQGLPIDWINGTPRVRNWIEKNASLDELHEIENLGIIDFENRRKEILLY